MDVNTLVEAATGEVEDRQKSRVIPVANTGAVADEGWRWVGLAGYFAVWFFAGWLVLIAPALSVGGQQVWERMTIASAIVAVPSLFCFLMIFLGVRAGVQPGISGFICIVFRLVAVGSGLVAVRFLCPGWGVRDFYGWLIGLYLYGVLLETLLVVRQIKSDGDRAVHPEKYEKTK